jgi:hypothetical protein
MLRKIIYPIYACASSLYSSRDGELIVFRGVLDGDEEAARGRKDVVRFLDITIS